MAAPGRHRRPAWSVLRQPPKWRPQTRTRLGEEADRREPRPAARLAPLGQGQACCRRSASRRACAPPRWCPTSST
eukprot:8816676-Alexandrium_andersonii.AAC.1